MRWRRRPLRSSGSREEVQLRRDVLRGEDVVRVAVRDGVLITWYHVCPLRKNAVSSPINAHVGSVDAGPYFEWVFQ